MWARLEGGLPGWMVAPTHLWWRIGLWQPTADAGSWHVLVETNQGQDTAHWDSPSFDEAMGRVRDCLPDVADRVAEVFREAMAEDGVTP